MHGASLIRAQHLTEYVTSFTRSPCESEYTTSMLMASFDVDCNVEDTVRIPCNAAVSKYQYRNYVGKWIFGIDADKVTTGAIFVWPISHTFFGGADIEW